MINKDAPFAHLRPTTTPEMLDRAYAVGIRCAPLLYVASLVFASDNLVALVNRESGEISTNPANVIGILIAILAGEFLAAVGYLALFQGLIFPLRPLSPKALARTAVRKLPGFLLTHLLYVFIIIISGVVAWGFFTASKEMNSLPVRATAGAVTALLGLYAGIRLCLAPVACLIEDSGPFSALARSWHLTTTRPRTHEHPADYPPLRWFAVAALPAIVIAAIVAVFAVVAYFALGLRLPVDWNSPIVSRLDHLAWFAAVLLASPLYWAGIMAFYVEYRMRHEALDFYLRIRELRRQNGDLEELT